MKLTAEMRSIPLGDRRLYDLLFTLAHLFPSSERVETWRDGVRRRIAERLHDVGEGKVVPVERVTSLSPEQFQTRYLAHGIPVIIDKGATGWKCFKEWSFESFKLRFGGTKLKLVNHKGLADNYVDRKREYSEEVEFGEFLDQVQRGGTKYMRFSPILESFPELIEDFDHRFLCEMPGDLSLGTTFEAFIGGVKSFTPLHNAPTPFFFVNACGIKRWAMIPNHYLPLMHPPADGMSYNHSAADVTRSDPERYPGFDCIDRMEAVLEPGDILYVPSWFWHSVQNEAPTIGVRCGFMYPVSMVAEAPVLAFIRIFAARNPTLAEALFYTIFQSNLPARENMLLQPRMFWNYRLLEKLNRYPFLGKLMTE